MNIELQLLVTRTLQAIEAWSPEAVELLMGTSAHESLGWQFRRQLGGGPALGIYQIEPFTHDDCWNNYLNYRPDLATKILIVSGISFPNASVLEHNDVYSTCIARVKYMRDPQPIPHTIQGQAEYWKRVYNTFMGKGTVQEYINHYNQFVL